MSDPKQKDPQKIVPYRRRQHMNVGMIFFAIIFVYMSFSVYTYMKRDKVQFYEVVEGGIVNVKSYTGIILRDETTKYTDRAGDINYYVREGKRASVGTSIYSIDETGSIAAFKAEHPGSGDILSEEDLLNIKKQLSAFSTSYSDERFDTVYDAKYSLEALVMECASFSALDNLDVMMEQAGVNFQQVRSDQAGVISYAIDNYEDLEPSQVTEEVFDRSGYARETTRSGKKVPIGYPAYKIVTSDDWSVVFPLSEEDLADYQDGTSLRVRFMGRDLELTGDLSIILGADGKAYGKLDFHKYMIQFLSDRYVQFEIVTKQVSGLKIPISAVTDKTFYLVPIDYLAQGGDGDRSATGFMKEVYSEQGTSAVFVPATIYYSTEEFYYIDVSGDGELKVGDYLVKPVGGNVADEDIAAPDEVGETEAEADTEASRAARAAEHGGRFQLGASMQLQGVYSINKGYAVFKQIEVLDANEEYYTIKKGMSYGLAVYDHILLDASTAEEGKVIYQ